MEALLGVRNDCAADRAPTQWTPDSPAIVRGDVRGFTSDPTTFIFNPLSLALCLFPSLCRRFQSSYRSKHGNSGGLVSTADRFGL